LLGGAVVPDWLGWLAFAALLGVVEVLTLAFAAGLMAVAAVVAVVVAGAGGGFEAQALAFAASSFAALAVTYRIARRRLAHGSYRSGSDALKDQQATVVRQVDAREGAIRIGGDVWSARAYDQTQVIAEGTRVAVFQIEGATALVYTLEQ
jgi:membrane protein implicated in regulation of membrane protease activity